MCDFTNIPINLLPHDTHVHISTYLNIIYIYIYIYTHTVQHACDRSNMHMKFIDTMINLHHDMFDHITLYYIAFYIEKYLLYQSFCFIKHQIKYQE